MLNILYLLSTLLIYLIEIYQAGFMADLANTIYISTCVAYDEPYIMLINNDPTYGNHYVTGYGYSWDSSGRICNRKQYEEIVTKDTWTISSRLIYDTETIEQFVDYFNALDFTPVILIRFPSGGWYARDVIELKYSGIKYNIMFEKANDDYMLVKVNHRYYKVSLSMYGALLDIISNSTAGKAKGASA